MITYACPRCRTPMVSPEGMVGQSEKCPTCDAIIIVPRMHPAVPAPTRGPREFRPLMTIARPRGSRTGRYGIAGLVIGVVACLTLWAPIGFLHTAIIGAVGLVPACLGFVSARRGRGGNIAIPLVGGVICVAAIYFSLSSGGGAVEAPRPADKPVKSATAPPKKLAPSTPLPIGMARQWDDRSLKVLAVKVDHIPLRSVTGDSRSEDKFLMITIEASNTSASEDRKITYTTLRGVAWTRDRTFASLSDSKGRIYSRIDFGPDTYPAGGVARSAPLAPGGSVRDTLIFERPAGAAGPYRLELPLGNLGGVGVASWEIPESALR